MQRNPSFETTLISSKSAFNPFVPWRFYCLCSVCSVGVFSPAAWKQQLLCWELIISTSTEGGATKFGTLGSKWAGNTVLDFQ